MKNSGFYIFKYFKFIPTELNNKEKYSNLIPLPIWILPFKFMYPKNYYIY